VPSAASSDNNLSAFIFSEDHNVIIEEYFNILFFHNLYLTTQQKGSRAVFDILSEQHSSRCREKHTKEPQQQHHSA